TADSMIATSYLSFGAVPEGKSVEIKYTRRAAALSPGQRAPIQQQLAFAPYHASGLYDVRELVGRPVTPGPTPPTCSDKWTMRRNNAVVLKEGKLTLSAGKDTIEIAADQPEMVYVAIEAYDPASGSSDGAPHFEGGNAGRNTGFYALGAAVAPAKMAL